MPVHSKNKTTPHPRISNTGFGERPGRTRWLAGWRRVAFSATLYAAMGSIWPSVAYAQHVIVLVNGEPITALDVDHRLKLTQMSGQKSLTRKDVIDELIDEKLKLKEAKKFGVEITDSDVEGAYSNMAVRMGLKPEQLSQTLTANGSSASTIKSRIRAELAWGSLVRGRFRATLDIRDRDIQAALDQRKGDEKDSIGYEYQLRPVVVVVPRGSSESAIDAKRREAEAIRGRFQSCDDGIRFARALKDVAVREPITRFSADLPAQLREVLDRTPVGRLTTPELTPQGIEMFALCAKKETTDTPGKRQVRNEIFSQRFDAQAKRYLQEVRRGAMIEYR
jgi:peptidyl-prolyl cis-trans isomerase SurA